ncbi:hypothetical protein HY375_01330 [Candidatus Berkelbacteria bacterium]|nr:hypothetical protein [Candidatus Berkelbacteria bacterium]
MDRLPRDAPEIWVRLADLLERFDTDAEARWQFLRYAYADGVFPLERRRDCDRVGMSLHDLRSSIWHREMCRAYWEYLGYAIGQIRGEGRAVLTLERLEIEGPLEEARHWWLASAQLRQSVLTLRDGLGEAAWFYDLQFLGFLCRRCLRSFYRGRRLRLCADLPEAETHAALERLGNWAYGWGNAAFGACAPWFHGIEGCEEVPAPVRQRFLFDAGQLRQLAQMRKTGGEYEAVERVVAADAAQIEQLAGHVPAWVERPSGLIVRE